MSILYDSRHKYLRSLSFSIEYRAENDCAQIHGCADYMRFSPVIKQWVNSHRANACCTLYGVWWMDKQFYFSCYTRTEWLVRIICSLFFIISQCNIIFKMFKSGSFFVRKILALFLVFISIWRADCIPLVTFWWESKELLFICIYRELRDEIIYLYIYCSYECYVGSVSVILVSIFMEDISLPLTQGSNDTVDRGEMFSIILSVYNQGEYS